MKRTIYFDMDGTIADLYGIKNWLAYLKEENTLPYEVAKPLLRLSALAKILKLVLLAGLLSAEVMNIIKK